MRQQFIADGAAILRFFVYIPYVVDNYSLTINCLCMLSTLLSTLLITYRISSCCRSFQQALLITMYWHSAVCRVIHTFVDDCGQTCAVLPVQETKATGYKHLRLYCFAVCANRPVLCAYVNKTVRANRFTLLITQALLACLCTSFVDN